MAAQASHIPQQVAFHTCQFPHLVNLKLYYHKGKCKTIGALCYLWDFWYKTTNSGLKSHKYQSRPKKSWLHPQRKENSLLC